MSEHLESSHDRPTAAETPAPCVVSSSDDELLQDLEPMTAEQLAWIADANRYRAGAHRYRDLRRG